MIDLPSSLLIVWVMFTALRTREHDDNWSLLLVSSTMVSLFSSTVIIEISDLNEEYYQVIAKVNLRIQ